VLSSTRQLPSEIRMNRCILLIPNSEIVSVHSKILRDKRGHTFRSQSGIGMLPYIPRLQRLREDGASVPKRVGVDTGLYNKWCSTECVCWMTH